MVIMLPLLGAAPRPLQPRLLIVLNILAERVGFATEDVFDGRRDAGAVALFEESKKQDHKIDVVGWVRPFRLNYRLPKGVLR